MVYLSNEMKTIVASPVFRKFTQVNWLDLYRETMARKLKVLSSIFHYFEENTKTLFLAIFNICGFLLTQMNKICWKTEFKRFCNDSTAISEKDCILAILFLQQGT